MAYYVVFEHGMDANQDFPDAADATLFLAQYFGKVGTAYIPWMDTVSRQLKGIPCGKHITHPDLSFTIYHW